MNIKLSKEEIALILDALSQLPLAKSYNLFMKLLPHVQPQPEPAPEQSEMALGGTDD